MYKRYHHPKPQGDHTGESKKEQTTLQFAVKFAVKAIVKLCSYISIHTQSESWNSPSTFLAVLSMADALMDISFYIITHDKKENVRSDLGRRPPSKFTQIHILFVHPATVASTMNPSTISIE